MQANRIHWADYMKAFSIVAVVLNHTSLDPDVKDGVYLVCLPAFFFLAGVFTNTQLPPKEFFSRKTLRLLIPFLVWGLLSWLAWCLVGRHYGADAELNYAWWEPLWGMLCGKTKMLLQNPPLWFLCCMMSLEWIYYLIYRVHQQWLRWLIILTIGGIGCSLSLLKQNWIWEISAALIILPLYALGAEKSIWIKKNATTLQTPFLWGLLMLSLVGVWVGYRFNGDIALAETRIGHPALYYWSVCSVVGMWFSIALLIERTSIRIRGLSYIGQNTLFILCAHIPIFGTIKGITILCDVSLSFFDTSLGCICLWLGSLLMILPFTWVLNRYFPLLVGKKHSTP